MHSADLRFANLYKSDFSGAILIDAKIDYIDIRLSDAQRLQFPSGVARGITARGADLRNPIRLDQEQLNAIHGDRGTRIPEDLQRSTIMTADPFEHIEVMFAMDDESDDWLKKGAPVGEPLEEA